MKQKQQLQHKYNDDEIRTPVLTFQNIKYINLSATTNEYIAPMAETRSAQL